MKYVALGVAFLYATPVIAVECPPETPDCKVIYLSPQEAQLLIQQGGALDLAEWANKRAFDGVAAYFRKKIGEAAAGEKPKGTTP